MFYLSECKCDSYSIAVANYTIPILIQGAFLLIVDKTIVYICNVVDINASIYIIIASVIKNNSSSLKSNIDIIN